MTLYHQHFNVVSGPQTVFIFLNDKKSVLRSTLAPADIFIWTWDRTCATRQHRFVYLSRRRLEKKICSSRCLAESHRFCMLPSHPCVLPHCTYYTRQPTVNTQDYNSQNSEKYSALSDPVWYFQYSPACPMRGNRPLGMPREPIASTVWRSNEKVMDV